MTVPEDSNEPSEKYLAFESTMTVREAHYFMSETFFKYKC